MEYIYMNGALYHHGVKGMKWGVRKYQNKDGSLTPAGQKRYERDIRENNAKKKENRIIIEGPDSKRWVTEDMKRSKNTVDQVSTINRELTKINDTTRKRQTQDQPRMDLSHMTDKQLREAIDREMLERRYNETFNPPQVSKGRQVVDRVLEDAGSVLAVTSSALAIALAIRELTG